MELKVFPAPAVAGHMQQLVEARIHNDATDTQEAVRAWQREMIDTLATPSYAMIDPGDGAIIAIHEGPETDAELFAAWLEGALADFSAR